MKQANNEHFEVWGLDLKMPLIEICGYNEWQIAERLSWHSHQGYELVYLLEGRAAFEFEDGMRCELVGGEFFFKLPGQMHRAADDVTSPCKMCWIIFLPDAEGACINTPFTPVDLQALVERYRADDRKIFTYSSATKPLLDSFLQSVLRLHSHYQHANPETGVSFYEAGNRSHLFADAEPFQVASMRGSICQILLEMARQAMNSSPKKPDDFAAAAVAFIEKHYQDPIGVDQIAQHLGLSRSYLHTVFRGGTGQTPNDYLQRTRIRAAESMLEKSSSSVTEISSRLGFTSSQYFSKVFHKYTRQTPQEYRKSRAEKNS
ncbi:AraC family transcriptional regulator [bacterium]|nr:MAG: AraC family transcriptional regulator [bacterium]